MKLLPALLLCTSLYANDLKVDLEALADQVDQNNPKFHLYKILRLGEKAKPLGSRVVGWLKHENWEIRSLAARTIGEIQYLEGRTALEKCLENQTNWHLAHYAAKSLEDLNSKDSLPALEKASNSHWFPIVQMRAANSAVAIKTGNTVSEPNESFVNDPPFVHRDHLSLPSKKIKGIIPPKKASKCKHDSFRNFKKRHPGIANRILKGRDDTTVRALHGYGTVLTYPFHQGELLGVKAGEWYSSIGYIAKNGNRQILSGDTPCGIEEWNGLTLIASGFYHGGANEGALHRVQIDKEKAKLSPWFVLPGAPIKLWIDQNNFLIVKCHGGTMVFENLKNFTYHAALKQ